MYFSLVPCEFKSFKKNGAIMYKRIIKYYINPLKNNNDNKVWFYIWYLYLINLLIYITLHFLLLIYAFSLKRTYLHSNILFEAKNKIHLQFFYSPLSRVASSTCCLVAWISNSDAEQLRLPVAGEPAHND